MRRLAGGAVAVLLLAAGIAGCSSDDGKDETLPNGPLRDRFNAALAFVNTGAGRDRLATMFAPSFLEAISIEQFVAITENEVRPKGPYTVDRVEEQSASSALVRLRGKDGPFRMQISIERASPYRITGIFVRPAPIDDPPASMAELRKRLTAAAPEVGFLAAEVVGDMCRSVAEIAPDEVLALGSAFKLYVLGALGRAVADGRASWEERIALRAQRKVHSSPTYGDTAPGTEVALEDLAKAMISVSDNTATDHVMERVGRKAIEDEQAKLGLAAPARNVPFLTTRELSLIKFGRDTGLRDAYTRADAAQRSRLLATVPDTAATAGELGSGSPQPVAVDTIEWFASAADLCRVHVGLHKQARLRPILSANRGVDIDRKTWPYVAFKGGSEPGVLTVAWLGERDDGRTFVVAALLRNQEGAIDDSIAEHAAAAFGFLAQEGR